MKKGKSDAFIEGSSVLQLKNFFKKYEKDFTIALIILAIGLIVFIGLKYYSNYRDGKLEEMLTNAQRSYPSSIEATQDKDALKLIYKNVVEVFENVNKNSALSIFNKLSSIYLGNCYYDTGDYKNAISYYKNSENIKNLSPLVIYNIGAAYEQLNDYQKAFEEYEKIINRKDDTFLKEISYFSAIRCCFVLKKYDKVKALYEEFSKNYKDSKFLLITRDFLGDY